MSAVSDMYTMAARHGISSGIFMSLTDMKKHTVLHLASGIESGKQAIDPELWKTICGIIQLCNQALRHVSGCPRCNTGLNTGFSENFRLTEKQKDILKTFLDDSSASIKTAARIHNISVDSVNFHLRNIRSTLNKPRTSSHALAVLAQSMDLI
jgi:DNA-binding CsgD family transcriptional regulator